MLLSCMPTCLMAINKTTELVSWQFRKDPDSVWQLVNLPHSCNAVDGQSRQYYRGETHYRYVLNIDCIKSESNFILLFKSVAQRSRVWVNGMQVTEHKGGYTPFSINVTSYLHEGENVVLVDCNNEMDLTMAPVSSDFNKNNGLHDKVYLLERDAVYADTQTMGYRGIHVVQQQIEFDKALVEVQTQLVNSLSVPTHAEVRAMMKDAKGNVVGSISEDVLLQPDKPLLWRGPISIEHPHLWQGKQDPYLYTAEVQVYHNKSMVEDCTARVGLRSMSLDPQRGFILNGQVYPLRGFSYHQDCFNRASAVTMADIDRDFAIIDELGCNMLRLAHYPHNEYTFDLCDERGIIVQTEIPWVNECGANKEAYSQEEHTANLVEMFKEMIRGHYNHPSIAFWGMWNELGGSHANRPQGSLDKEYLVYVTSLLYDLGHNELDPTRFYGFADMGYGMDIDGLKRDVNYDYFGSNKYYGWYSDPQKPTNAGFMASFIDKVRERGGIAAITEYGAGSSPFCHSEFPESTTQPSSGGARHDEEWANVVHEEHVRLIKERPWLLFTSCWVLFDFAVADRLEGYIVSTDGTSTIVDDNKRYINDKGIVSRDRTQKKDAFYLYKAWWNPEPTIYIASRRFFSRSSDAVRIKVYSNARNLTLYQNGKKIETLDSCPDSSGIIWNFAPINFVLDSDTFTVKGIMADGTVVSDQVVFQHTK